jgi:hypothetical protein
MYRFLCGNAVLSLQLPALSMDIEWCLFWTCLPIEEAALTQASAAAITSALRLWLSFAASASSSFLFLAVLSAFNVSDAEEASNARKSNFFSSRDPSNDTDGNRCCAAGPPDPPSFDCECSSSRVAWV